MTETRSRQVRRWVLAALLLPAAAGSGELAGGALRLEVAAASAGGRTAAGGLTLELAVGQPLVAKSANAATHLHAGFFTPSGVIPGDLLFADGFEETGP